MRKTGKRCRVATLAAISTGIQKTCPDVSAGGPARSASLAGLGLLRRPRSGRFCRTVRTVVKRKNSVSGRSALLPRAAEGGSQHACSRPLWPADRKPLSPRQLRGDSHFEFFCIDRDDCDAEFVSEGGNFFGLNDDRHASFNCEHSTTCLMD